jgi:hypothetical protein
MICHPHPHGGGTLHNKVVYHAMKALNAPEWGLGWPVLRFNFRGTGLSQGTHDGEAEANEGRIDAANEAFARAARDLDQQSHTRERIELRSTWGRALRKAGREPEALDVLESAAELAVQPGNAEARSKR